MAVNEIGRLSLSFHRVRLIKRKNGEGGGQHQKPWEGQHGAASSTRKLTHGRRVYACERVQEEHDKGVYRIYRSGPPLWQQRSVSQTEINKRVPPKAISPSHQPSFERSTQLQAEVFQIGRCLAQAARVVRTSKTFLKGKSKQIRFVPVFYRQINWQQHKGASTAPWLAGS